ncbi:serine/threonine kinase [Aureococcus anophagefferens]|nr:serine/threonine kinase [Aureococcus anophagefferens]
MARRSGAPGQGDAGGQGQGDAGGQGQGDAGGQGQGDAGGQAQGDAGGQGKATPAPGQGDAGARRAPEAKDGKAAKGGNPTGAKAEADAEAEAEAKAAAEARKKVRALFRAGSSVVSQAVYAKDACVSNHVDSSDLTPGILIAVNIGKRGPTSTFVFPRLKQAVVLYHGDTLVFDSKEAHCLATRRARLDGLARPLAVPDAPTAVVLGEAYDAASLSVAWQPPFLDGGATISAYRVEIDSSAGFDFHGDDYRVDEVAFVHEVQTFVGVYGNVGLLTADDSYLIGDDARIEVEEVTEGYCDVVSGGFSYEVQTVQAHTLTQGAQDASLMVSDTADLSPSSTAEVVITERIKGADAFRYAFDGLDAGKYFARVTAYNSAGYGPVSSVATATPRTQPGLRAPSPSPLPPHVLDVTWTPPNDDGGAPVLGYDIEWYSEETQDEVQVVTLSASDGVAEIQSVTTEADTDGLSGYFTLELRGETTEIISVDAPAEGEGSVKTALERLSSSGEIEGKGFIEVSKGAFHQTGSSRLDQNDLVFVAGEQFRVRQIDYGAGRLELGSDDFTTPALRAPTSPTRR